MKYLKFIIISSVSLVVVLLVLFFTLGVENEIIDPCGYAIRGLYENNDLSIEQSQKFGKIAQMHECWNDSRWPVNGVVDLD